MNMSHLFDSNCQNNYAGTRIVTTQFKMIIAFMIIVFICIKRENNECIHFKKDDFKSKVN